MLIDKEELDKILKNSIERNVPSVAASIISSDKIFYNNQFGYSSYSEQTHVKDNSLYRIASMTKAITAVCILQLIEKGQLNLDSKLRDYFPEVARNKILKGFDKNDKAIYSKPQTDITILHLLTHTSGYGYEIWNKNIAKLIELGELTSAFQGDSKFLDSPLIFDPGSSWEYGIGIDWLGALVEKVSDLNLQDYMTKNIFNPLCMGDTSYDISSENVERLVSVHNREGSGYRELPFGIPERSDFYSGGANLICTLSDYSTFLQMILNNGTLNGRMILKNESVEFMAKNHMGNIPIRSMETSVPFLSNDVDFFQGKKGFWGLGFLVYEEEADTGKPKGSLCSYGLFNSFCWVDHKNDLAGLIIMQLLPFFDQKAIKTLKAFEEYIYK